MRKITALLTLIILLFIVFSLTTNIAVFAEQSALGTNDVKYIEDYVFQKEYDNSYLPIIEAKLATIEKTESNHPLQKTVEGIINFQKMQMRKQVDYSVNLYDLATESPDYICVQFTSGGYAIMNKKTKTIYERSNYGINPYHDFAFMSKLYYAGPTNYISLDKESNLVDIMQNIIIDKESKQDIKENMIRILNNEQSIKTSNYIQDEINKTSNTVKSSSNSTSYDSTGWHALGEGNPLSDPWLDIIRMLYFYLIDPVQCSYTRISTGLPENFPNGLYYTVTGTNLAKRFHFMNFNDETDALYGGNRFGSCIMVAIGMLLQFYERLGLADTIPSNTSAWTSLYSYNTTNFNLVYSPAASSPSVTQAERLHQYFIRLIFPNLTFNNNIALGVSTTDFVATISNSFSQYYNNNNVTSAQLEIGKATSIDTRKMIAERIYYGDPAMLIIYGAYKMLDESGSYSTYQLYPGTAHACVAYSYSMVRYVKKKILFINIYDQKVDEFKVHFGSMDKYSSEIIINESVVYQYALLRYSS